MPSDTESSNESQYIASRYEAVTSGPGLSSTFEVQEGVPYDGTNKLARQLSPFTIRIVLPDPIADIVGTGVDVNLLGRAGQEPSEKTDQANSIRQALGVSQVSGANTGESNLITLLSTISAGQQLQSTLGTDARAMMADLTTVADIKYQVEVALQVPPLTLFVNPSEMSIQYQTVQQFTARSRHGFIFERWGEGQPTISFSGSTGAFCAGVNPSTVTGPVANDGTTASPSGVQFASKRDSAAFQNFVALYQFYRNNGYIYDTVNGTEAHLMIGALAIDYDQMTYIGHIDSFEYSYTEEMQHRIEWSMEFTVDRMYDHAESPVVVLPESSPTPAPGSLSTRELSQIASATPTRSDLDGAGWAAGFFPTSGSLGPGEEASEEEVSMARSIGTSEGSPEDMTFSEMEQIQQMGPQGPFTSYSNAPDAVLNYVPPSGLLG